MFWTASPSTHFFDTGVCKLASYVGIISVSDSDADADSDALAEALSQSLLSLLNACFAKNGAGLLL